jgi:hypothetical protein
MRISPKLVPAALRRGARPPFARGLVAGAVPVVLVLAAGCGATGSPGRGSPGHEPPIPSELASQARPVGRGMRFHPPVRGRVIGPCRKRLEARVGVHVEVFAADRVVLIPAGIGAAAPRTISDGRVLGARCYGALVTLEPTGLVLVRAGAQLRLSDLFRSWGQPLSARRLGPFSAPAGALVMVFVDGRAWHGQPREAPLRRHAEIVLEVGPRVPPHSSFAFPPGT